MITCNLMGGLGNQIFQIFATISYAIKSRNDFKFTNAETLGGGSSTIRNTYWNSFFSRLKHFTTDSFPQMKIIREKDFTFIELPFYETINNNVLIYGYFQSYKYFEENYEIICRMIGLEQMKDNLLKKINYESEILDNAVSMHFRIGDYKNIQHVHPIMTKEYYEKCLNYIQSIDSNTKFTIFYFCEDTDLDDVLDKINYLSTKFSDYNFVRGEKNLSDWEQMLLMSCCHHNIIPNSSFSWWGAYFNSYVDKIVCYPSTWFGPAAPHNTKDLCPSNWIQIKI
jgi:hypothetical protein